MLSVSPLNRSRFVAKYREKEIEEGRWRRRKRGEKKGEGEKAEMNERRREMRLGEGRDSKEGEIMACHRREESMDEVKNSEQKGERERSRRRGAFMVLETITRKIKQEEGTY